MQGGLCYTKYMKQVSVINLSDSLEINVLYEKGKLAYTFEHNGKTYGNAIKLDKKSVIDIVSASLLLFTNALQTKQSLT